MHSKFFFVRSTHDLLEGTLLSTHSVHYMIKIETRFRCLVIGPFTTSLRGGL